MNKKCVYVYITTSLILILGLIASVNYIENILYKNKNNIIFIDNLIPKQIYNKSQNIEKHTFKSNIPIEEFKRINSDTYKIILYKLDCYGYKVYFNNQLIGSKGSYKRDNVNIWNSINEYEISTSYISNLNEITIELYTNGIITPTSFPIIITNNNLSNKIVGFIKTIFLDFSLVVIGVVIFSTLLFIIIYISSEGVINKTKHICFQLSIVLIIIYLLDYLNFIYMPISKAVLGKICMISLYLGVALVSISLNKAYKIKAILFCSLANVGIILFGALFTRDYATFRNIYSYTNLLLLINILFWIIGSLKNFKNSYEDKIVFIASSQVIILGIKDVYSILNGRTGFVSYTVFAILIFCLGIVFISLENYLNSQNTVYTNAIAYKQQKENYKNLSITDPLTKLYNQRYLYEYLNEILSKEIDNFSLLFGDLDHFKRINDTIGHKSADLILIETANIIKQIINSKGLAFRYGGEEIVVILENMHSFKAYEVAEEIRKSISSSKYIKSICSNVPVTISIGIATYPIDTENIDSIIEKADKAMYYAKQIGRNSTKIYNQEIESFYNSKNILLWDNEILLDYIYALIASVEAKDSYTARHSEFVVQYSMLIADSLKLTDVEKYELKIGALLHDCGKIGIPDNILNKDKNLTAEECDIIKTHTVIGNNIVKNIINDNSKIIACIRNHHERWDGKGYPDGFYKEEIPLFARILAVADTFDAMTSDRPYREALSKDVAILRLIEGKSTQFDPNIVEAFVESIK